MIRNYYELAKPGLVYGNLITVIAGFLLGESVVARSAAGIHFLLLIATVIGICFVMASGCAFNNYIDRDIDGKMERTKGRALVTGKVSGRGVLVFAVILGVLGFATLALCTNMLTAGIAFLGFFFYVFMYSLWWKRKSAWGTFVGAISGATPPVVGYVAATNRLDPAAALLFAILVLWQMPHFFAIGIRRATDYAAASVPILPVKSGIATTKVAMLLYIIAFALVAPLLTVFGYTGRAYLAIALLLGVTWLALCIKGFFARGMTAEIRWAKAMFFFSLFVMMTLFITIAIGALVASAGSI